jgi:hypothetical protein
MGSHARLIKLGSPSSAAVASLENCAVQLVVLMLVSVFKFPKAIAP